MRKYVLLVGVLAACGSSTTQEAENPAVKVPDLGLTAPASGEFQLILDPVKDIQPGKDIEYCTWTDKIFTEDTYVKAARGFQSRSGHHIVINYVTGTRKPAGTTEVCGPKEMGDQRFVIGAGDQGQKTETVLPGDLVNIIPKGAQIVVNHHYVNPTAKVIELAQSAITVRLADTSKPFTRTSIVAVVNSDLSVPVGRSGLDVRCKMDDDYKIWRSIPHAHEWAERVTVDHIHAEGGASDRLWDVAWEPSLALHNPEKFWEPTAPLVLKKGDELVVHCDWNNTTGAPLPFGMEMCLTAMNSVDSGGKGNFACDKGKWTDF